MLRGRLPALLSALAREGVPGLRGGGDCREKESFFWSVDGWVTDVSIAASTLPLLASRSTGLDTGLADGLESLDREPH